MIRLRMDIGSQSMISFHHSLRSAEMSHYLNLLIYLIKWNFSTWSKGFLKHCTVNSRYRMAKLLFNF
jgi:hypothetical protein